MRDELIVDGMIRYLVDDCDIINSRLIQPLQNDFEHFPDLTATSWECWAIEKQRLHNYWQQWSEDVCHINTVHRRDFDKIQKITDEISEIKRTAHQALEWLHETKHPPRTRLNLLNHWWHPKESPEVVLYRRTRQLYKYSWEKGWIENMDGFGTEIPHSDLDKRHRDFKDHVRRLRQRLEEAVGGRSLERG